MSNSKKNFISKLKTYNIKKDTIDLFSKINQEDFFDPVFKDKFYSVDPVPIGYGEKSDSPLTLARMIDLLSLENNCKVLEIGSGSGYSTAVLSCMAINIVSVELHEELALSSKKNHKKLRINNVKYLSGNIYNCDSISGIFDRIIILAAMTERPWFLIPFLKEEGIMVFPMGPVFQQQITVIENIPDDNSAVKTSFHDLCIFDPLIQG